MREILFKAKRKNWKEFPRDQWWVEGYIVRPCTSDMDKKPLTYYFNNTADECGRYEEVIVLAETVCQYTGLKAKKLKKVFEGDILKDRNSRLNEVIYDESFGAFIFKGREVLGLYRTKGMEIVGNVFDNPEFLE